MTVMSTCVCVCDLHACGGVMRQCPQGPAGQDAQPHVKSERQEQCERYSSILSKSNLVSDGSMHVCAICVYVAA